MIEQLLFQWLTGYAALSALIGTRIYPNPLPQAAPLPAVAWQKISAVRVYSQQGSSGLVKARFQFDCWGTSAAQAIAVANALITAVHTFPAGGAFSGHPNFIVGERDVPEPQSQNFRRMVDALILYQE